MRGVRARGVILLHSDAERAISHFWVQRINRAREWLICLLALVTFSAHFAPTTNFSEKNISQDKSSKEIISPCLRAHIASDWCNYWEKQLVPKQHIIMLMYHEPRSAHEASLIVKQTDLLPNHALECIWLVTIILTEELYLALKLKWDFLFSICALFFLNLVLASHLTMYFVIIDKNCGFISAAILFYRKSGSRRGEKKGLNCTHVQVRLRFVHFWPVCTA